MRRQLLPAAVLALGALTGACGRGAGVRAETAGATSTTTSIALAPTNSRPLAVLPPSTSTTSIAPATTTTRSPVIRVAGVDASDPPCPLRRTAGDELAEAEEFLRAVARGEDVDDRIAPVEFMNAEGSTRPTDKFLERVHASLAEMRGLTSDLVLAVVPEMAGRCLPVYSAGCDFVGDLHTFCVALLQRAGRPSVIVTFTHAGRGLEAIGPDRTGAALAALRAARDIDVEELFGTDVLDDANGARSPRPETPRELADALRRDLDGSTFVGERCIEAGRHLDCTVTMRRDDQDLVVRFLVAPNADFGWAIESYAIA